MVPLKDELIAQEASRLERMEEMMGNRPIVINEIVCTGCGLCREICPFGLPEPVEGGKFRVIRFYECVECSACQRNCPVDAIVLVEREGCGCLWDIAQKVRDSKNKPNSTCC